MAAHTDPHHHAAAADHGAHPGPKLYWVFCFILCLMTFLEWLIFDKRIEWGISNGVMIPTLLAMSLVKFVMVVGWYMHLRFDPGWLKRIFTVALVMGGGTAIILVVLLSRHS